MSKKAILLLLLPIVILLIAITFYRLSTRNKVLNEPPKVIMKVGNESIYQNDYDTELAYYPQPDKPDARDIIMNKMIEDSVIIQGSIEEGLIEPGSDFYDSPEKDYMKRTKLVEDLRKQIEEKSFAIHGHVVAIWFYNNNEIGSLGYEGGKQFAKEKITEVYDEVVAKRLTIQEAGAKIKADTTLKQIDAAYDSNAIYEFRVTKGKRISFDPEFDEMIWALNPGELTEIRLSQDVELDTGEYRDALYMFAQLDSKDADNNLPSFADWLVEKKTKYVVQNL